MVRRIEVDRVDVAWERDGVTGLDPGGTWGGGDIKLYALVSISQAASRRSARTSAQGKKKPSSDPHLVSGFFGSLPLSRYVRPDRG